MLRAMSFYGLPLGQDCHAARSIGLLIAEDSEDAETGNGMKKRKAVVTREYGDAANATKKKKLAPDATDVAQRSYSDTKKKAGLQESSHPKAASEPPKTEYVHVRARRGQATDSHSLAERARREKISERMKYLQDLVPGCNSITGKASVLDEIINYVQSLQKQVEFLSMKLAAVDPLTNFFIEKGMNSSTCSTSIISREMPSELLKPSYPLFNPLQPATHSDQIELGITMNLAELGSLHRTIGTPVSVPESFSESHFDVCGSSAWDYNLQELYNKMMYATRGREDDRAQY